MTSSRSRRISIFVVLWLFVFSYESLRQNYLGRWLHTALPKVMFLFPPAGWIMFYNVGDSNGWVEVYGRKGDRLELIDPHRIFETRWVGYDNIRRNVLVGVLDQAYAPSFCRYLRRKFPAYDGFVVARVLVSSVSKTPQQQVRQAVYRCD
jgi:hypothetical protein